MREFARIERITKLIKSIWVLHPDMRYGQFYVSLISSYFNERGIPFDAEKIERRMFLMEDSDFEEYLKTFTGFKPLVKK